MSIACKLKKALGITKPKRRKKRLPPRKRNGEFKKT